MPISVTCSSCSAAFSVKDDYAGKRAKCPSCKETLTIPGMADTVKMPPPARPVVASRPKPAEVDEAVEDTPKPKRRRDDEEGDEDAPRRKRREADDEERPRGKRRRREDDDAPKKKSALPLILGILGGVVLVCGGGCAGVWFGVIAPAAERARARNNEWQAELDDLERKMNTPAPKPAPGEVSRTSAVQLRTGMTQREVDEILGGPGTAGHKATTDEVTGAVPGRNQNVTDRWHAATREGRVFVWTKGRDKLMVAYNTQPGAAGGTVLGVLGLFDGVATEFLPLTGPVNPTTQFEPPPPPAATVDFTTTADVLAAEFDKNVAAATAKYNGKSLRLTGVVAEIPRDAVSFSFRGVSPPASRAVITVPVDVKFGYWGPIKTMKVGDTVTVTGKFKAFEKGKNNTWELKVNDALIATR